MRRTRLRVALLVVVAGALSGIGYKVARSVLSRQVHTLRDLGVDFLPEVAQHIRDFRRVKVENGRTVWEITAKDAQYYEKTNQIVVREPRMTIYLSDGTRQTRISGSEGRLTLIDREIRDLTLRGGVVVEMDDLRLDTSEATYDRSRDLITAPGAVTIRGRRLDVKGQGMEVEVGPQNVRLLRDVHTVLSQNDAAS
jgi:LPS export ABC transporter protein LptC